MKNLLFITSVLGLAGCLLLGGQSVHAATTTSDATFSITAADNPGDLTLTSAPNYTFTEKLNALTNPVTGSADKPVTVTDARGTGAGWTLTAQLGNFNNTANSGWSMSTGTTKVTYAGTDTQLGDAPTVNSATLNAGGDAAAVMTANAGAGLGAWSAEVSDPVLNTGTVKPMLTKQTATITWNLADTQTTSTADTATK